MSVRTIRMRHQTRLKNEDHPVRQSRCLRLCQRRMIAGAQIALHPNNLHWGLIHRTFQLLPCHFWRWQTTQFRGSRNMRFLEGHLIDQYPRTSLNSFRSDFSTFFQYEKNDENVPSTSGANQSRGISVPL